MMGMTVACISVALVLLINLRKTDLTAATFRDALIYATVTWIIAGVLGAIP
ncbi:potassium transporter, partial [Pseudoalteromonas sp. SG43-7]|nr:potassium transporter [Pseudoalteromonas sp. SG43-7]